MRKIEVLDCTLRDGGYVNQWKFGHKNITNITNKLIAANIDIVECGFLTQKFTYDSDTTLYNQISQVYIVENAKCKFVCLMNYGEYDIECLPLATVPNTFGIRVAFHKKEWQQALELSRKIKEKGYNVYLQPMVSMSYTKEEFIELINKANELRPEAFYIVDSFGYMKKNDLLDYFDIVEHYLDSNIKIGFHSHNNLQLSYSNAQLLCNIDTKHNLIIDSSVLGMGRGAGNLNSELFVEYLNEFYKEKRYSIEPLFVIIDEVLNNIYLSNYWGYSLAYYLSAIYKCHPNYATYLEDKNTLTVEGMNTILSELKEEEKDIFNKKAISDLYESYQKRITRQAEDWEESKKIFENRDVLLIAPGASIKKNIDRIRFVSEKENVITVAINFLPEDLNVQYIFVSNMKRYQNLGEVDKKRVIMTTNIESVAECISINYARIINQFENVADNAGLMMIKLCFLLGVKNIYLAGFDGYSENAEENYVDKDLELTTKIEVLENMNTSMKAALREFGKKIQLHFITKSKYEQ